MKIFQIYLKSENIFSMPAERRQKNTKGDGRGENEGQSSLEYHWFWHWNLGGLYTIYSDTWSSVVKVAWQWKRLGSHALWPAAWLCLPVLSFSALSSNDKSPTSVKPSHNFLPTQHTELACGGINHQFLSFCLKWSYRDQPTGLCFSRDVTSATFTSGTEDKGRQQKWL